MTTLHKILVSLFVVAATQGCGVKGRPLPPEKPAELGRGKPTFTRTTEDFRFRNIPPFETEEDTLTKDEEEKT
jgi:hypothetical protein